MLPIITCVFPHWKIACRALGATFSWITAPAKRDWYMWCGWPPILLHYSTSRVNHILDNIVEPKENKYISPHTIWQKFTNWIRLCSSTKTQSLLRFSSIVIQLIFLNICAMVGWQFHPLEERSDQISASLNRHVRPEAAVLSTYIIVRVENPEERVQTKVSHSVGIILEPVWTSSACEL